LAIPDANQTHARLALGALLAIAGAKSPPSIPAICSNELAHCERYSRSDRPDCDAAIVNRRLGRTAEQGDQLSHRIRHGAEQSASSWLHNAPTDKRRHCAQQFPARRKLSFFQPNWVSGALATTRVLLSIFSLQITPLGDEVSDGLLVRTFG